MADGSPPHLPLVHVAFGLTGSSPSLPPAAPPPSKSAPSLPPATPPPPARGDAALVAVAASWHQPMGPKKPMESFLTQ
ncbi:hypothetical protein ACMHYB_45270 [Sorangium sp. So ce1128]